MAALRGLAALAVVYGHAGMLLSQGHGVQHGLENLPAWNGWKGIYLFFALSGYLISLPFVRSLVSGGSRPSIGRYARRRAARILPAHWIALCVMAFVVAPPDVAWGPFAAHMLLIQNFVPGVSHRILPVTWTLGLEAIFYVLVPVLTWAATRSRLNFTLRASLVTVGLLWLAGVAVFVEAGSIPETPATTASVVLANVLVPVVGYLAFFAPGMLIAFLECHRSQGDMVRPYEALRGRPALSGLVALTLWCLGAVVHPPTALGGAAASAMDGCIGLFAVTAVLGAGESASRRLRRVAFVGEWSYGIYLWHWVVLAPIVNTAVWLGLPRTVFFDQTIDWLVITLATLPLAAFSWRYIESPLIAWARGRRVGVSGGAERGEALVTAAA